MTQSIELQGRRLIAPCNASLDNAALSTLRELQALNTQGPPLHPGSVIMFGWAPLKVCEEGRDWVLCEPDFTQSALAWVRGVGATLHVLDSQAAVVHALGVEPRGTFYDDSVLIEPAAESSEHVFLERLESRLEHHSGWCVGIEREEVVPGGIETLEIPAARVLVRRPEWMPYLALPPGFQLVFRARRLVHIFDADGRDLVDFLERRISGSEAE